MFDHHGFLSGWEKEIPNETLEKVKLILSGDTSIKRYVYGRTKEARELSKAISLDGVIDDYIPSGTVWNGLHSCHIDEVPANGYVVNGVICGKPRTAWQTACEAGIENFINYSDLTRVDSSVPLFDFVQAMREDLKQNNAQWQKLFKAFRDTESAQDFQNIVKFRLTGDISFTSTFSFSSEEQYFADFITYGNNEVFVDSGGFDGYTTENFCRRCPDYKKVYLFEPVESNMDMARRRLAAYSNIEFILKGMSDCNTRLYFDSDSADACAVAESGSEQIEAVKLDDAVDDKVTFIKMDLEGHELQALEGSREHIRNDKPKLAISVYHRSSDFYNVYDKIMAIRPDYKVYLKHYTEGYSETIMYFI